MDETLAKRLSSLYYEPHRTTALGGKKGLLRELIKRERPSAEEWLSGEDAYTLHKPAVKTFKRRPTIVSGLGKQLQADLMDVSSLREDNDNTKFLLTTIDVFSKKAWVVPITTKSGAQVAAAIRSVLRKTGRVPKLQTDKGKEFYNRDVKSVLKEFGVDHFSTENEQMKASIVERFNRTLRGKIYRYITAKNTLRYVDILPQLVEGYNNTVHTATGLPPNDVSYENQQEVWERLYERQTWLRKKSLSTPKLSPGDHVRISKARGAFERGYTPNWSKEIFRVKSVETGERPLVYRIEDLNNEEIHGTFYEKELQKVRLPDTFKVEEILRWRGRGRQRQALVKWQGYPESFNSWVKATDIV